MRWKLRALARLTMAAVLVSQPVLSLTQVQAEGVKAPYDYAVQHDGDPIEGGTLHYAIIGEQFAGVLNSMFNIGGADSTIIKLINPGLIGYDEGFAIDNSGLADVDFDIENNQVTLSIPEGLYWDDGEPMTIDDAIFPYYVVGHPDYTGIRYGEDYINIIGMEAYHAGETDTIEGIQRVDDYTMTISYKKLTNSVLQVGGTLSLYIEPEHAFEGIEVADMEDSEPVRIQPVGFGPFKFESMVPGESVVLVANEHYYKGEVPIDRVIIDMVSSANIVPELRYGNYDIVHLQVDQYEEFKDLDNVTFLANLNNSYSYVGFKMGTWDDEKGEVNYEPDRVTANPALRQAMAYALDREAIAENFYNNLRWPANSHVSPNFVDVYNPDQEGYSYDPDRSREILAEAGFVDLDGDGLVEDPNGEPFVLGYAAANNSEVAEPLNIYFLQQWQAVGIPIELVNGQLMEQNVFWESIESDDPAIDVWQDAWTIGGDPNQTIFYGRDAGFNDYRWATEENDELLSRINSDQSFDPDFRREAFYDWQAYMIEYGPTFPLFFSYGISAVNKRVSQYNVQTGNDLDWTEIYLLADAPYAHGD